MLEALVTSGFDTVELARFKSDLRSIQTVLLAELEDARMAGGRR